MPLYNTEQAESRSTGFFHATLPIGYEILGNIEIEGKYRLRYLLAET